MSALIFPGLQESDLVRGEFWREGNIALSQQLRDSLEKLHLKFILGGNEKNTGTDRVDLGFSVVNTGKRKGEMHSYLFEVMDKAKAQGQNGTVQKGCNPADSFCVA